jgi:hypothetical protein
LTFWEGMGEITCRHIIELCNIGGSLFNLAWLTFTRLIFLVYRLLALFYYARLRYTRQRKLKRVLFLFLVLINLGRQSMFHGVSVVVRRFIRNYCNGLDLGLALSFNLSNNSLCFCALSIRITNLGCFGKGFWLSKINWLHFCIIFDDSVFRIWLLLWTLFYDDILVS